MISNFFLARIGVPSGGHPVENDKEIKKCTWRVCVISDGWISSHSAVSGDLEWDGWLVV